MASEKDGATEVIAILTNIQKSALSLLIATMHAMVDGMVVDLDVLDSIDHTGTADTSIVENGSGIGHTGISVIKPVRY